MSEAVADLLRRQQETLGRINESIEKGDQREMKAWRTAYKRINERLHASGYQHKPVEKLEP